MPQIVALIPADNLIILSDDVSRGSLMPDRSANAALSMPISEIKADLFRALAHPARIRVLEVLTDGEASVGEMQPLVGIELSHLSQQLGVLRRAGVVTTRKEGSTVFYALRDPEIATLLAVAKRFLINTFAESQELLAGLRATPGRS
jgi:ArsR family transcriptional regulator